MSKASEWAKVQRLVHDTTVVGRQMRSVPTASEEEVTVHAGVGHREYRPILCLTDKRLGGIYLSAESACELARWILDTFAEGDA